MTLNLLGIVKQIQMKAPVGMIIFNLLMVCFISQVGFIAGSNGQPLPAQYLNALDSVLIPVIHSRGRKRNEEPIVMELIFYILENIT